MSDHTRLGQRGFTFIELVVVLTVISIGWFSLVPNLDLARRREESPGPVEEVNAVMSLARQAALATDQPQVVMLLLDKNALYWNKQQYPLSLPVSGITVNGEYPQLTLVQFFVYRSGIMDKVKIQMSGDVNLVSVPLEGLFTYDESDGLL